MACSIGEDCFKLVHWSVEYDVIFDICFKTFGRRLVTSQMIWWSAFSTYCCMLFRKHLVDFSLFKVPIFSRFFSHCSLILVVFHPFANVPCFSRLGWNCMMGCAFVQVWIIPTLLFAFHLYYHIKLIITNAFLVDP